MNCTEDALVFPKRSVMLLAKFSSVFTVCTLPPATCCWLSRAAPEHTVNGKNHAPNVHVKIVSLVLSPPPLHHSPLYLPSRSPPPSTISHLFSASLSLMPSLSHLSQWYVCARSHARVGIIYICVCVCMCVCSRHCYYYYLYSSSTVLLIIRKEKQQQTNTN